MHRVEMINKHIGMVYSGMGPDYRLLVKQARKIAQSYYLTYKEPIPVAQLVQRVATLMQEYTQSGYRTLLTYVYMHYIALYCLVVCVRLASLY